MAFRNPGYLERCNAQMLEWVAGNSVHNTEDDECCPDFSCCKPELKADESLRKEFAVAEQKTRNMMLADFLHKGLAVMTKKRVFITGEPDEVGFDA